MGFFNCCKADGGWNSGTAPEAAERESLGIAPPTELQLCTEMPSGHAASVAAAQHPGETPQNISKTAAAARLAAALPGDAERRAVMALSFVAQSAPLPL
eukprot:SAG31_NODE_5307_length_2620_cov_2.005157_3_plen_98_part_01